MNLCKCGCGGITKPGNRYIRWHHRRGKTISDWQKKRISEANLGKEKSELTRQKLSIANKGKTIPKDVRIKISNTLKGGELSPETKRKISKANRGHIVTKETKQKIAKSNRGKFVSKKTRKKISLANIGKKLSEETRRKISISNKQYRSDGYCGAWSDQEYKEDLRNEVCSSCGMTNEEHIRKWNRVLGLHHMDANKKNCHPDNIDTLCLSCHTIADAELRRIFKDSKG